MGVATESFLLRGSSTCGAGNHLVMQYPQVGERVVPIFPGGHWRLMVYNRYIALKNKAVGTSHYIRKHSVYKKPGAVMAAEAGTDARKNNDLNVVAIPNAVLMTNIYHMGVSVMECNPERADDIITPDDVNEYIRRDHNDNGLEFLINHFITGAVLNSRVMWIGSRLRIPAAYMYGLRNATPDAFGRGMTKYSGALVRMQADMHR